MMKTRKYSRALRELGELVKDVVRAEGEAFALLGHLLRTGHMPRPILCRVRSR